MHLNKYRLAWLGSLLITLTLACNLLSGLGQDVANVRETAEAAATQVRGLATQAQGIATEVEQSGLLKTAQAMATEEGGRFLETAQALATEADESGLLETARAFATEEGSALLATVQARATQGFSAGEAPADVPLLDQANVEEFFGSQGIISYITTVEFSNVLNFYKTEMPANGWTIATDGNLETNQAAVLHFSKENRTATLTLSVNPVNQKTTVVIIIESN